jgi:hypothetical protein
MPEISGFEKCIQPKRKGGSFPKKEEKEVKKQQPLACNVL